MLGALEQNTIYAGCALYLIRNNLKDGVANMHLRVYAGTCILKGLTQNVLYSFKSYKHTMIWGFSYKGNVMSGDKDAFHFVFSGQRPCYFYPYFWWLGSARHSFRCIFMIQFFMIQLYFRVVLTSKFFKTLNEHFLGIPRYILQVGVWFLPS